MEKHPSVVVTMSGWRWLWAQEDHSHGTRRLGMVVTEEYDGYEQLKARYPNAVIMVECAYDERVEKCPWPGHYDLEKGDKP